MIDTVNVGRGAPPIEVRHRNAARSVAIKTPERRIVDVTSRGEEPWVRFSPFFPHGGIPIPFSTGVSESVEGIWQGLKVFEHADVDESAFRNAKMRGLKRTTRRFGNVLGHRRGPDGASLLDYAEARAQIYLPSYDWVLDNRLANELAELIKLARATPVTLLDYETNTDVSNLARPLSHAGIIVDRVLASLD